LIAQHINERAQALLKGLVECYIQEGQPVGSTTLAKKCQLEISSATVRNVIADLEKMGLVKSPHTSSGRIPTVEGYRLFIDNLLTVSPMGPKELHHLQSGINSEEGTQVLLESATAMLSDLTKMAGIVTVPQEAKETIRQIEFLPLSENRILVILVYGEHDVRNKIIHSKRAYSTDELIRIANCLNAEFIGKDLAVVRKNLVNEMENARHSMDMIMLNAIKMANQIFSESNHPDYIIAGETNLMQYQEMADVSRLKQLFDVFSDKQTILNLLDQSVHAPGVQIFIGYEAGSDALEDCSIISATYTADDEVIGTLGVVGPTRMAYDRVIPIVDVTAKLLGSILKKRN
jgi:heat-inducible transcriptional repressor